MRRLTNPNVGAESPSPGYPEWLRLTGYTHGDPLPSGYEEVKMEKRYHFDGRWRWVSEWHGVAHPPGAFPGDDMSPYALGGET